MAGQDAGGLREDSLLSAYLFYGEEEFLAEEFVEELKALLASSSGEDFHLTRFDLDETKWREIVDTARTAPFLFESWRAIVVRVPERKASEEKAPDRKGGAEGEEGKGTKHLSVTDQSQILREYFASPPSRTVVVVVRGGKVRKDDAVVRFFQSLPKAAVAVREMKPLPPVALFRRVDEKARALGKTLTEGAKKRLFEIIGQDLRLMMNEVPRRRPGLDVAFGNAGLRGGRGPRQRLPAGRARAALVGDALRCDRGRAGLRVDLRGGQRHSPPLLPQAAERRARVRRRDGAVALGARRQPRTRDRGGERRHAAGDSQSPCGHGRPAGDAPGSGLLPASASTDVTAGVSDITSPANGATLPVGSPVTIQGTATDAVPGLVGGIEVSVDGGATWHPAEGLGTWSYVWTPPSAGAYTILSRAVDGSTGGLKNRSAYSVVELAPGR